MSNNSTNPLPVNYDFQDTSPDGLERFISEGQHKIPGALAATLLEMMQANVASGMAYRTALHHTATMMLLARIDVETAEITGGNGAQR